MIMHRKSEGTYEEVGVIRTKDGSNIDKILGRDGSVYFTSAVDKTVEGYPCILPKSVGNNAVNYSIYGNSTQDGTPSPDNPVEVQSVGERTKNLFDISNFQNNVHLDNTTGLPIKTSGRCGITMPIEVSGNSFVLTFDAPEELVVRYMYSLFDDENKLLIRKISEKSGNVVDLQNAKYVYIAFYSGSFVAIQKDDISKIQFELGSVPIEYEPYGYKIPVVTSNDSSEPVTTNIYLDEPLKTGEMLKFPENVLVHADGTEETVILPKIPTFKGTTVITTNTEIPPSNIKITYKSRR